MVVDSAMKNVTETRLTLYLPHDLPEEVNAWRRTLPDLPSLNEALRRLIRVGLQSVKAAE